MLPPSFWQGVFQFNQQEFYPCHDTLEALWMEASDPDRDFYQGILQIAVGCYHLSNLNWRGAVILLGEGIRRLNPYQPHWQSIDVAQLVAESRQLLAVLQQLDPNNLVEFVETLQGGQLEGVEEGNRFPKIIRLPAKVDFSVE